MNTEKLAARACSGDDEAFYQLIQSQKEMLYRTAYSYVKNKDDALDIVSEAIIKAYRGVKKLKEPAHFNTWLTRILINCSLDHKKKFGNLIPVAETPEMASTSDKDSVDSLDLHQALEILDDDCRTVIILKYFQDMTITQISQVMDRPSGTIKTYLHRALKTLRIELKEDWQNV